MFLSGTFGLSEGVALYPTEALKDEYWSPYRPITDQRFDVQAIRGALEAVADTFFTRVDPSPSSAGTALSLAVDPNLVTFDMLRTALHLHLERAGVPSASLSTTLDQIQRQKQRIEERGGDITRTEVTFFLPAEGFTITPFGLVRSEEAEEARTRAERAEEERQRTQKELKAENMREKLAELMERSTKDLQIVEARVIAEEAKTEVDRLRARVAELEREAKEKTAEAEAARAYFESVEEAQRTAMQAATDETREARREGLERAEGALAERAPEREGVTRGAIEAEVDRQVVEEIDRQFEEELTRIEKEEAEDLARALREEAMEARRQERARAEAERREAERFALAIPALPEEIELLSPRERAERLVPLVRPPEEARPPRVPWNKKVQDANGRWRLHGRFTTAPRRKR